MMNREELVAMKAKELLVIAKELQIVGRHEMKKEPLIDAIMKAEKIVETKITKAESEMVQDKAGKVEIQYEQPESLVDEEDQEKSLEKELAAGAKGNWDNEEMTMDAAIKQYGFNGTMKPKEEYIEKAKVGTIVAFKVNDTKILSGKIEEIYKNEFFIRTKNGAGFKVRKKNIVWVKTGDRWPKGVYQALRGELNG